MGQGSLINSASPRRVEGGWVKAHDSVIHVSATDGCTAALTSEGAVYTWGSGLAGQLGHGTLGPCTMPKLVSHFCDAGLRVMSVSCGPYHTAATTQDGGLYTWGNGLFGKLGHGDTLAAYHPRRVTALEGSFVTSVACGWWHTAAVVCLRHQHPLMSEPSGALFDGATTADSAAFGGAPSSQLIDAVESSMTGPGSSHVLNMSVTSASNSDSDVASVSVSAHGATLSKMHASGRTESSMEALNDCMQGEWCAWWRGGRE